MPDADLLVFDRFLSAQAPAFASTMNELKHGRKCGHWMWFIFPQLRGLGRSAMAEHYGLGSLDEARAFLAHPLLGPRLILCTEAVLAAEGRSLRELFGSPDDLKFSSCMTLFALASGKNGSVFRRALGRWCGGRMDGRTLALLGMSGA
jgi:uncharacterized protein (DUF1810 family)